MTRDERMREALDAAMNYVVGIPTTNEVWRDEVTVKISEALSAAPEAPQVGERLFRWTLFEERKPHPADESKITFRDMYGGVWQAYYNGVHVWDDSENHSGGKQYFTSSAHEWLEELPPRVGGGDIDS